MIKMLEYQDCHRSLPTCESMKASYLIVHARSPLQMFSTFTHTFCDSNLASYVRRSTHITDDRVCLNDSSVGSGLEDVAPPGSFGERLPGGGCGVGERDEPSPRVLLCVLPRLAVELSRLELVVLADVLAGVSPRRDHEAGASSEDCPSYADGASKSLEVVVEARGATIVLHEAAEFAEDPGPHSFVLNLGSACLHVGGSDKPVEGSPAPLMTVSAGDLCVHETLRCPLSRRPRTSGGGRVDGPLLFFPGKRFSACPMVEDLPALGFVSI